MTATEIMSGDFDVDLAKMLPRLRAYALSLTHNGDHADDLVQQTAEHALAGRRSFRPGTNFVGWLFRIERNAFISNVRRHRSHVDIDDTSTRLPFNDPTQETGLMMREFLGAFRQISKNSRQAILLSQLNGSSLQQIADHTGVAVGTVKSRISRGRGTLNRLLAA